MRWNDINLSPERAVLRQFGLLCAAFAGGFAIWRGAVLHQTGVGLVLGIIAALSLVMAWFRPEWLRPVFVASLIATFPIGWVVSNVVLLLVFYGMILPLALFFRWQGRDLLELKSPTSVDVSFWRPKATDRDKRRYFRQF